MEKYALIQKGEIVKFRTVDEFDYILVPKLIAHNYLPVVETIQPEINQLTQTLADSYDVLEDKVEHKWSIIERDSEEIDLLKEEKISQDALDQIKQVWDDVDWEEKVVAVIEKKHTDESALADKEKYL